MSHQAKAYSIWLTTLTPANVILVIGGGLLSLVAGASLLIEQGVLTKEIAGVLALISAGFTLIHNKLQCDQHQAECKKLKSIYEGLSEDYANLKIISDVEELKKNCRHSILNMLKSSKQRVQIRHKGALKKPNNIMHHKQIHLGYKDRKERVPNS